jgi:hypothetical protein
MPPLAECPILPYSLRDFLAAGLIHEFPDLLARFEKPSGLDDDFLKLTIGAEMAIART